MYDWLLAPNHRVLSSGFAVAYHSDLLLPLFRRAGEEIKWIGPFFLSIPRTYYEIVEENGYPFIRPSESTALRVVLFEISAKFLNRKRLWQSETVSGWNGRVRCPQANSHRIPTPIDFYSDAHHQLLSGKKIAMVKRNFPQENGNWNMKLVSSMHLTAWSMIPGRFNSADWRLKVWAQEAHKIQGSSVSRCMSPPLNY